MDEAVIRSDPNRTLMPGFIVSAVCHVPHASHPSYTQGYYDRDNDFYLGWDKISESPEAVKSYLDEWVYGVKDRAEYWQKLGPDDQRHQRLAVRPPLEARGGRITGSMSSMEYSSSELMIVNAARLLKNGDVVFVGVGQPNLACNLAKRTHAPDLVMIYEAGVIGAEPSRLPLSIGDPTLVSGALSVVSMYDIFANYLQRGNVDVGFLGGAQIDKYGNINATVIGSDYAHPKVRLPGSGGAQEIAAWANRCYIMTPHQKRRFPEKVDFLTSAGYLDGRGGRAHSRPARQGAGWRGDRHRLPGTRRNRRTGADRPASRQDRPAGH